ncbi:MAG: hypothetical protein AAGA01_16010 [Cyanobacteria bacterium P01_E01_bin.43]
MSQMALFSDIHMGNTAAIAGLIQPPLGGAAVVLVRNKDNPSQLTGSRLETWGMQLPSAFDLETAVFSSLSTTVRRFW